MSFAAQHWFFLLFVVPILVGAAAWVWLRRGQRWQQLISPRLRSRLSRLQAGSWHFVTLGTALLGLTAMIIALAAPEGEEESQEVKQEGRNILLLLDISRSMTVQDIAPDRLTAAKAAAQEVLDAFPNDRAGLMVFAGETYMQVPLTIDRAYIRRAVSETTIFDIPTGGSDLARAIREGTESLVKTGQTSNVMIILSDGEEHTEGLTNAAREARKEGIFVFALGFGTKEGGKVPDSRRRDGLFRDLRGGVVHSSLNDTSLRLISQETDGIYSHGVGPGFLRKLSETIQKMEAIEGEGKQLRVAKPLFQWFLLPGILLVMISVLFRLIPARQRPALIMLTFVSLAMHARADDLADGKAALNDKDYAAAARHFGAAARDESGVRASQLHLAAGAAAYQARDWTTAAASFGEALLSDRTSLQEQAHFALANTLFYQGAEAGPDPETKDLDDIISKLKGQISYWKEAEEHLQEALTLNAENQPASENLASIQQQIKKAEDQIKAAEEEKKRREEEKQNQPQQQQQQQQNSDQNQPNQSTSNDQKDSSDQSSSSKQSDQKNPSQQKNSPDQQNNSQPQAGESSNDSNQQDSQSQDKSPLTEEQKKKFAEQLRKMLEQQGQLTEEQEQEVQKRMDELSAEQGELTPEQRQKLEAEVRRLMAQEGSLTEEERQKIEKEISERMAQEAKLTQEELEKLAEEARQRMAEEAKMTEEEKRKLAEQIRAMLQEQLNNGEISELERARRLLRQLADPGRRPPRARAYIPRRPEKDW